MPQKKKKKKFRIKFGFIIIFLIMISLCVSSGIAIINIPIKNIYIEGNSYLSDQEIIELAKINDYPSTFKNGASLIKKRLEENIQIKTATIKKKFMTQIYIKIEENKPLFYNQSLNKTVLLNEATTEKKYATPILINYVPDIIYSDFIKKMGNIKKDVLNKISEIKYDPDEVDDSRFLLTMTDANYVYLTINKFELINNYNDIVKEFNNKKGILYLNAGGYFKIIEK